VRDTSTTARRKTRRRRKKKHLFNKINMISQRFTGMFDSKKKKLAAKI